MKILYFMNHADKGGAMLALYDLLVELKKYKDIEPIVITGKKNKFNKMLDEIEIENYSAPFKNFISSYKSPKLLFKIILWIRYIICKPIACYSIEKKINFNKIDIIHTNLDRIDIGAYFAKKYNIPHIWHIREHLDDDFVTLSIFNNYIKHMEKYQSLYIAISSSVKEKWKNRGLPENKIKLVYDGININKLITNPINFDTQKIKMVFLGGYTKNKGQEYFINILGRLPEKVKKDIKIDFYGNGSKKYLKFLNNKIKQFNLSEVVNLYDYNPKIYCKLKNYNIGINCSKAEGFGRITVEYMLAGLCPIVSNTGANPELVTNKQSGIVYNYEDEDDLLNKIIYIYNNRNIISDLQRKARDKAIEQFSIGQHTKTVVELYRKILSKEEEF